jgi:nucleoside-diphosphate-sugar epimerase
MPALFCFGLGYSAEHYIAEFGARFDRIIGTVRTRDKAAAITARGFGGRTVAALVFDGKTAPKDVAAAVTAADAVLVSVQPDETGDPALIRFSETIAANERLATIVYLSTIGVYGDHGGAWIDETTTPSPLATRSRERLAAENVWRQFSQRTGKPVAILRLSGIYGPGQNALAQLSNGAAKRIVKPGQVFNRIHVEDIAQAIDAAFAKCADGVFNVSDDEPAPAPDVIAYAARLLGIEPPPEISYADAEKTMTAMAKSFYGEVKRVRNIKMKTGLGVALRYPAYREGLTALLARGRPF